MHKILIFQPVSKTVFGICLHKFQIVNTLELSYTIHTCTADVSSCLH